jgi:hypothetical protein
VVCLGLWRLARFRPVAIHKSPLVYVNDLESYRITAVEREIDYLSLTLIPTGEWILDASQSIRFWGTFVSEPGSVILLLMGVAHLCLSPRLHK